MGPTEIPSQSTEVIKIPTSNYEFGANFIDPKVTEHLIYYAVLSWHCYFHDKFHANCMAWIRVI